MFKKPNLSPPPPPPEPEPITEVGPFYDWATSGRSELEAFCRANNLQWGILSYGIEGGQSPGQGKTRAQIMIGTVYDVDVEGEENGLDRCLLELAQGLGGK